LATSATIQNKQAITIVKTAPRPIKGILLGYPTHFVTKTVTSIDNKIAATSTTQSLMKIRELMDFFISIF